MKLVEILARELQEWPEGAVYASQDKDMEVRFSPSCEPDFFATALAVDASSDYGHTAGCAIVTRAMWEDECERVKNASRPRWNGEGLPPVGEIIEWLDGEFLKAVVVGHHQGAVVAVDDDDPRRVFIGKKPCYRPIRTPEQIAAEERENAVDEMVSVWRIDLGRHSSECYEMAAALHDAGYRRE